MNYEIVTLQAKTIVGKSVKTGNADPAMGEKIGGLWNQLYDPENGYYGKIRNRMREYCALELYSDYNDGDYFVTVGAEVSQAENPEFTVKTIPAGKYAKFSVKGNMVTAVAQAWQEIWTMNLDRTFTGDFDEYQPCECDHADRCDPATCCECRIDIYVAIR